MFKRLFSKRRTIEEEAKDRLSNLEFAIGKLEFGPNDKFVIHFPERLSIQQVERLQSDFLTFINGSARCLVLEAGAELKVIKAGDVEAIAVA